MLNIIIFVIIRNFTFTPKKAVYVSHAMNMHMRTTRGTAKIVKPARGYYFTF